MSRNAHDASNFCLFCHLLNEFQDSGAASHLRNARKEILLAVKALIEAKLSRLEPCDSPDAEAQKIEIQ